MEDKSKRDRDRADIEHASHAPENEGEGSRSGARDYEERTRKFLDHGDASKKAKQAERALDGKEGESLRKAEEEGKRHAKGEDPKLHQKSGR